MRRSSGRVKEKQQPERSSRLEMDAVRQGMYLGNPQSLMESTMKGFVNG